MFVLTIGAVGFVFMASSAAVLRPLTITVAVVFIAASLYYWRQDRAAGYQMDDSDKILAAVIFGLVALGMCILVFNALNCAIGMSLCL
jgi:hypothetical protein